MTSAPNTRENATRSQISKLKGFVHANSTASVGAAVRGESYGTTAVREDVSTGSSASASASTSSRSGVALSTQSNAPPGAAALKR
jgi:hypothetical protein